MIGQIRDYKKQMKTRGFTLIELLVVIAIIAILVAFVSSNFLGARQRAKDVRKKVELDSMKSALRLYYNDYSIYPATIGGGVTNTFGGCGAGSPPSTSCASACGGVFVTGAGCNGNLYMKLLPPTTDYVWHYQQMPSAAGVAADDFCLYTTVENQSDPELPKSHTKCNAVCNGVAPASDFVVCAD